MRLNSFKSLGLYEDKDRLRVLTDGCKLENGEAGFGVFFETPISGENTVGQKLGQHAMLFQAEVQDFTKACKAVLAVMSEEGVPSTVTIYSDSQSVLQALFD